MNERIAAALSKRVNVGRVPELTANKKDGWIGAAGGLFSWANDCVGVRVPLARRWSLMMICSGQERDSAGIELVVVEGWYNYLAAGLFAVQIVV